MKIPCSNCNQNLEIPEELAGQTIECPSCNASLAVPATKPPSAKSPSKIQLTTPKASTPAPRPKPDLTDDDKNVLKNYAGNITKYESGSEQQMAAIHTAGLLAGSKTEYKPTSMVFVRSLIGGVILIALFFVAQWIRNDPWENSTVKAHRKIASIESVMVDKMNSTESLDEQVKAIRSAISKLERIDAEELPQEYRNSLLEMIMAMKEWGVALKNGDIEKVEEFDESRIYAVRRLNEIMESKGRY